MTRRVLKWTVPVDDQWHPIGGGPVALVDIQPDLQVGGVVGVVTVWTVETVVEGTSVVAGARVFGTGQEIPSDVDHLGSCQDGPLVWHLFRSAQSP